MAEPQAAVCADGELFAVFTTFTLKDGDTAAATVRQVAAALQALTKTVSVRQRAPDLVSAIGFGAEVWPRLYGADLPPGLVPFEALADGPRRAPATPADIFLHIHSTRHDANFALMRAIMGELASAVTVVEEIYGFRNYQNRDLTGFVDGTENPAGDERPEAGLVPDDDAVFAGGSFVSVQRYVHGLPAWERLSVSEQEAAIGRTKVDDIELDDEVKAPYAHIARVVIEEDGEELAVIRHSLTYGTTRQHGLYFVAYGATPGPFRKMLERMVIADADGQYDRLLDYTKPVTGAAFFAPSVTFLRDRVAG